MKHRPPASVLAERRRLLGALAALGSFAATARTAEAAVAKPGPVASAPVGVAADGIVARERWLLRWDDC